jgi:hypothetical protein
MQSKPESAFWNAQRWKDPPVARRTNAIWFFVACCLGIWASLPSTNCFVSRECHRVLIAPALAVGIASCIDVLRILNEDRPNPLGDQFRITNPVIKYLILAPFTVGMLGYVPIAVALPSLIVTTSGHPFEATMTVTRTRQESFFFHTSHCYRILTKELEEYFDGKLCVSEDAYHTIGTGDKIVVSGSQSWFGIGIARYRRVDPSPKAVVPSGEPHPVDRGVVNRFKGQTSSTLSGEGNPTYK